MSSINPLQHLNVKISDLKAINNNASTQELEATMKELLDNKIHGISFSAYQGDQDPGSFSRITEEQIRERMSIIGPYTKWIRTFSSTYGNENIPKIAHEMGLKTVVGAWIGSDLDENEAEIANIIEVAKAGHADIVAVGNEVLLREDISVEALLSYIRRVKEAVPDVEVGYVDAYYLFADNPEVADACDVIFANCYPFWEHCSLEHAVNYMAIMYETASKVAKGKKVIVSETGWPSQGSTLGGAIPSYVNAMKYFINTFNWAQENDIDMIYFSSFDEEWKIGHEGDCGAYWGVWDKDGHYKY